MIRIIFFIFIILCETPCFAQSFVLTPNGLCSSTDQSQNTIVLKKNKKIEETLYNYCTSIITKSEFSELACDKEKDEKITLYGYSSNLSYLVYGSKNLRYIITLNFLSDNEVEIRAIFTKNNGDEINYRKAFSKDGSKVKLAAAKKGLEETVNKIINKLLGYISNL